MDKKDAFHSHYIIDGIRQEPTPAELIEDCLLCPDADAPSDLSALEDIIDETAEPPLSNFTYDIAMLDEYVGIVTGPAGKDNRIAKTYSDHGTRLEIARWVIKTIWNEGRYQLSDMGLMTEWQWTPEEVGNMAAFYESVRSASEYAYDLGIRIGGGRFTDTTENGGGCRINVYGIIAPDCGGSTIPSRAVQDTGSWIIYIPFDTCRFRLGNSHLARALGMCAGPAPKLHDPDYFIDCYEVVRELAEDRIITAGTGVEYGGLAAAAERLRGDMGMDLDLRGLMASYQENDRVKLLFSEVPGALIQVSDSDFDYVDSQFLLQDVAYYPVGKLTEEHGGIRLTEESGSGIADILSSLLNQASEGED